jgi:hypothetical protein
MSRSPDPEPSGGPPRPKPRPYQPPPGAAKPPGPPPGAAKPADAERPKYQPPPGAAKPPTPTRPPGAGPAPAPQARPAVGLRTAGTFEFSFEQDALLKDLGRNMRTISWVALIAAVGLLARYGAPLLEALRAGNWGGAVEPLVAILVALTLGYSFFRLRQSGGAFTDIVDSQAQDLPLLLQALRALNGLFASLSLIAIVIGGIIVLGIIGYAGFGMGRERPKAGTPPAAQGTAQPGPAPRR